MLAPIELGKCYEWDDQIELATAPSSVRLRAASFRIAKCSRVTVDRAPWMQAVSIDVVGWRSLESCMGGKDDPYTGKDKKLITASTAFSDAGDVAAFNLDNDSDEPSSFASLSARLGRDGPLGVADWCAGDAGTGPASNGSVVSRVGPRFGAGRSMVPGRLQLPDGSQCRFGTVTSASCPPGVFDCLEAETSVFPCYNSANVTARYGGRVSRPGYAAPSFPLQPASVLSELELTRMGCDGAKSRRNISAVIALGDSTISARRMGATSRLLLGPEIRPEPGIPDSTYTVMLVLLSAFAILSAMTVLANARGQCFLLPLSRMPYADIQDDPSSFDIRSRSGITRTTVVKRSSGQVVDSWDNHWTAHKLIFDGQSYNWHSDTIDDTRILRTPSGQRLPMVFVERRWKNPCLDRFVTYAACIIAALCLYTAASGEDVPMAIMVISVAVLLVVFPPWPCVCTAYRGWRHRRAQRAASPPAAGAEQSTSNPINSV